MSAVDSGPTTVAESLDDGTRNVLLLAPSMDSHAEDGCADLLSVVRPSEADVLYVTFTRSPDQRLSEWQRHFGNERPAKLGFVNVDDPTRSAAAATETGGGPGGEITIRGVSSPGNLTDLGIQISSFLSAWDADGHRTVLCFDSLTTLLQYADLPRIFRFLHVLTGRVRSSDGFAHYHLDPSAHDERTLNTLKTLFDGIVQWDGEGWTVKKR